LPESHERHYKCPTSIELARCPRPHGHRQSSRSTSCASPTGRVGERNGQLTRRPRAPLEGAEEGDQRRILRLVAPLDDPEPPDKRRREGMTRSSPSGPPLHRRPRSDRRSESRTHQLLIASLLPSSMATRGVTRARLNQPSMTGGWCRPAHRG
jgi:hypothetical protein